MFQDWHVRSHACLPLYTPCQLDFASFSSSTPTAKTVKISWPWKIPVLQYVILLWLCVVSVCTCRAESVVLSCCVLTLTCWQWSSQWKQQQNSQHWGKHQHPCRVETDTALTERCRTKLWLSAADETAGCFYTLSLHHCTHLVCMYMYTSLPHSVHYVLRI